MSGGDGGRFRRVWLSTSIGVVLLAIALWPSGAVVSARGFVWDCGTAVGTRLRSAPSFVGYSAADDAGPPTDTRNVANDPLALPAAREECTLHDEDLAQPALGFGIAALLWAVAKDFRARRKRPREAESG